MQNYKQLKYDEINILKEVAVNGLNEAIKASELGADRIEFCS